MAVINVTPTIAQMENLGWMVEGKASRHDTKCPWQSPDTCRECPVKCHLKPETREVK